MPGIGIIETKVKIGEIVVLPTVGFTKLQHKGDEYYIGPENQILAKVNNTTSVEDVLAETQVSDEDFDAIKSMD